MANLHEIGPFQVICGSIVKDDYLYDNPAIIIDADPEMHVVLKMGNAKMVTDYYNTMVAKYASMHFDDLIENLKLIVFDKTQLLSADDICTIFNTIHHCTGHDVLNTLTAMDYNKLQEEITKLQSIGY